MSKKVLSVLFLVSLLLGCKKPEQGETSYNDPAGTIQVVAKGSSEYTIVYPAKAYTKGVKDAKAFRAAVYAATKLALPIQSDAGEVSGKTINIGATKAALAGPLSNAKDHEWKIEADSEGNIFIGSKDEDYTCHALYVFETSVLKDMDSCCEGRLALRPSATQQGEDAGEPLSLKHFVANGNEYYELKHVFLGYSGTSGNTNIYSTQGAVGRGDYGYYAFRDNANGGAGEKCIVIKTEFPSGKLVSKTSEFTGTHANSMAYCDADGLLYLVSANGVNTINRINPETMEVVNPVTFTPTATAITYNGKQGKFMMRSGSDLYITDAKMNVLIHTKRTDNTSYTTQGVGSDDTYCYFPVSPNSNTPEKVNHLLVYDWKGIYQGLIKINLSAESEDMWVDNGRYFVNFAESGFKTKGHSVYELLVTGYEYRTKLTKTGASINL